MAVNKKGIIHPKNSAEGKRRYFEGPLCAPLYGWKKKKNREISVFLRRNNVREATQLLPLGHMTNYFRITYFTIVVITYWKEVHTQRERDFGCSFCCLVFKPLAWFTRTKASPESLHLLLKIIFFVSFPLHFKIYLIDIEKEKNRLVGSVLSA